jgi:O-acetyl-ADP-ribose deacetylase (regulator of RNase III)
MGQDLRTSATIIERATRNSLALAETRHIASIAFPAFGTGVGAFPMDRCARLMVGAIRAHASRAGSLRLIRLVLFGIPAYRVATEVAAELLGPPLEGPTDCPVSG